LPNVRIISILPFSLEPRIARVANAWIYDPQLWDLSYFALPNSERFSRLTGEIALAAKGRPVVLALGAQNRIKGFEFFAQLWCGQAAIREKFLFLAAGKVAPECVSFALELADAGGFVMDRHIEDDEFLSLYRCADVVWSCYAPIYDQASGIFGRAVQLGVPAVVRERSFLDRQARELEHPTLGLQFGDATAAVNRLQSWAPSRPSAADLCMRVARMRELSEAVIGEAIGVQIPTID
jgi:hypothetical protein